jgi:hypothetical protein
MVAATRFVVPNKFANTGMFEFLTFSNKSAGPCLSSVRRQISVISKWESTCV